MPISRQAASPINHGALELPSVIIDSYNLELRNKEGFIGDRASKRAFAEILEDWRQRLRDVEEDPLGDTPTEELGKKRLDELLVKGDVQAAGVIQGAIEEFAQELATVLRRFLRSKGWTDTQRIVAGGGFRGSRVGELALGRAAVLLKASGLAIDIVPIRHHPDEAGLIGAAHLMPSWTLGGYEAILAVDIGGSNVRAGVVMLGLKEAPDLSRSKVWKSELWRHADDSPGRTETVARLVTMLQELIEAAGKEKIALAPLIGIGCPGVIEADGSISRGGQNLPGGNWESNRFNLPEAISAAIPTIGGHETMIVMHNDAVVQGLSQLPFMQDMVRWGVITIGTGLGNARFTNKAAIAEAEQKEPGKRKKDKGKDRDDKGKDEKGKDKDKDKDKGGKAARERHAGKEAADA